MFLEKGMSVLQNGNCPINRDDGLACSFCGKPQHEVIKLIAGPHVYICNECIMLCAEILEEEDVSGFEGKYDSLHILEKLQAIKTMNQAVFLHVCAYVNGMLDGLRFSQRPEPDDPPATSKPRRRPAKKSTEPTKKQESR